MSQEFKQVIMIPGCDIQFATKAEAVEYLRRPKIKAALMVVTEGREDLSDWLIENQDTVLSAFDTGTIRRVTKSEKKKLDKAVDALVEAAETNDALAKACAFLVDNSEAVKETFRWPKVKRMSPEEKALMATNTLKDAADGDEKLAEWVIAKEEAILEAYNAGKEKREVSPKASSALAAYRAGKKEEKRLKEEEGMSPADAKKAGDALTAKLKREFAIANGEDPDAENEAADKAA